MLHAPGLPINARGNAHWVRLEAGTWCTGERVSHMLDPFPTQSIHYSLYPALQLGAALEHLELPELVSDISHRNIWDTPTFAQLNLI